MQPGPPLSSVRPRQATCRHGRIGQRSVFPAGGAVVQGNIRAWRGIDGSFGFDIAIGTTPIF